MPIQRLLDNGMEYSDAVTLHAQVAAGRPWIEAAEELGERDLARAGAALSARQLSTARAYFRYASACYRFAQSAIVADTERKLALYRKVMSAFAEGCKLDRPPSQKVDVPFRGRYLGCWLLLPGAKKPPVVLIFGGADGWRESYFPAAQYLLERGVAALLVDGPGQGETRLFNQLYLTADVHEAYSAILSFLLADQRVGDRIGIWGNSMGGHFAARAACEDQRFAACCVNGGSPRPIEILDRYPRFVEKFRAMTGATDPLSVLRRLDLADRLSRLSSPLLVLHGVPDQVFLFENARTIYEQAGSQDKQLRVWEDGDHCIYNHAHEKHCLVADWFAARLV